ncbi:sulfatase-like hydrolase/transferase [Tetragenococcus halophilus]|uniref:Sulfatase-like hydrolase/transferase n=2 Tax=Tetragenococcus halophilus TaxID=51669 RepID=A0AB37D1F0_TETHA|nr:sulfatase-like hydrolase/transferase [Tetragenococcus halophilus]
MLLILILFILLIYIALKKNHKKFILNILFLSVGYILLSFFLWHRYDRALWNLPALFYSPVRNPQNMVLCVIAALVLYGIVLLYLFISNRGYIVRTSHFNKRQWVAFFFLMLFIFAGSLIYTGSYWTMHDMGNVRFDQIVYIMSQPLRGTDPAQIRKFIVDPLFSAICFTSISIVIVYSLATRQFSLKKNKPIKKKKILSPVFLLLGVLMFSSGLSLGIREIGYADVKAYYFEDTEIYDNNYVDPADVDLQFPKEKRNLVYIFLESMESSYADKSIGGNEDENLIPNLTDFALNEGTQFSNAGPGEIGGMMQIPGANQTASSMVSQTSGAPLRASNGVLDVNAYGKEDPNDFFPGVYSLGEVLDKEDYNQMLFMGSKADYAGKKAYFEQHGNYDVRDYYWARQEGLIPEDYYEWWGYEDDKLFDFAKDSLTELADQKEPFNFTMLTADTHFEDGYATDETPDLFGDQYSNVIHDSDEKIKEFIDWMKTQPFYEDTTVVLVGDHLTMDSDFFEDIDPNYQRTVYNVFLNTGKNEVNNNNRLFSALDMYPSTLSALDVQIPGDRLGLGVDLFSGEQTLMEQMGYEAFDEEMTKRSDYYDKYLMQGSDYDIERRNADE